MNYVPKFEDTSAAAKSVVKHREKVTAQRSAERERAAAETTQLLLDLRAARDELLAEHSVSVAAQRVLDANAEKNR